MKQEKINIGNFYEEITWRQPSGSKDSFGQTNYTYSDYKTDYADIQAATLAEGVVSERLQYSETYTFTTHYDAAVTNNFQIQYNGEKYNIIKIEYLNLKRFMRTTAEKIND